MLFADIVGFTRYCDAHPAEQVVANLHEFTLRCEDLIDRYGLEKIKSIGDGIVATANLLAPHVEPVRAAVDCGFALVEAARATPAAWELRVGVHLGPVVTSVVGRSKFTFDLWGDTVNVAARLADLGSESAVHISQEAQRALGHSYAVEPLGAVPLKGKGDIQVYRCHA